MIEANHSAGHETSPPHQQFAGMINEEHFKVGHNTLVVPTLRAQIREGDTLVIAHDAESPSLGDFHGAPVVAELELGGSEVDPIQKAVIAKVDPKNRGEQLRDYLSLAEGTVGVDVDKPYFVVALVGSAIYNFTLVKPSTHFGLFGRFQNNMDWFDAHGVSIEGQTKTTVIPNPSVSRQQLILGYAETGGIRINGHTDRSSTLVTTVATADHRRVLEHNEAQKENEVTQSKLKTAGRISKLLSRGR